MLFAEAMLIVFTVNSREAQVHTLQPFPTMAGCEEAIVLMKAQVGQWQRGGNDIKHHATYDCMKLSTGASSEKMDKIIKALQSSRQSYSPSIPDTKKSEDRIDTYKFGTQ